MLASGTALQPGKHSGAEGLAMHGPRSPCTSWHVEPFLGWRVDLAFSLQSEAHEALKAFI